MTIPLLDGLSGFIADYDALILDLWGVAHDGRAPYPGALDCLSRLGAADKRRLFLSNAPRRSDRIAPFLENMGIRAGQHYDDLISSGDVTREALARRDDAWHAALGRSYYHIGPERDLGLLDGLDYQAADGVAAAAFLLCTGLFDDEREGIDDYAALFDAALERPLPMVCVNPDLTVMRGAAEVLCAGSLAAAYADRGGEVRYHGKPHRRAYDACFDRLDGIDRRRILVVGDSLRTDIAGAVQAGVDAVLVTSGIHADELGAGPGQALAPERLEAACAREGVRPLAALPAFLW
jgi:HAD superfamily hydrolase (TIGR01459 family)